MDNDNFIIWLLLTPVTTNNLHFLLPLSVLNFFRVKSDYFLKGSLSESTYMSKLCPDMPNINLNVFVALKTREFNIRKVLKHVADLISNTVDKIIS